jgi:TonB family protein
MTPTPNDTSLGERELDVMAVLWEIGSGTVQEVKDKLSAPLAYTTVLTIMRNLEAKRFVTREEEGRAHRYFPRVQQKTAQRNALSRLVSELFHGSPSALLAHLVDNHDVSSDELQALAKQIKQGKKPAADMKPRKTRRCQMIAAWMMGSVLFALLLFVAAFAVERALRSTGRATRMPWAFALAAAVVWPFAAPFVITLPPDATVTVLGSQPVDPEVLAGSISAGAASVSWSARIETALLVTWLLLTVVMVVRLILAAQALRRITDAAKREHLDGEDVLITNALGPAVIGLWTPRIAVPEWFLGLDSSLRRVVLRHERQHCESRDPQLVWLASVAVAIMPWNPAVWMMSRRLRLALEIDCDSRTLQDQTDTRMYSQLLLLIAQRQSGYPLASMLAESNSHLRRRITAMQMTPLRKPTVRVLVFTGVAAGAIVAACSPRIASDLAGPGEKPISMLAAKKEAEYHKPGTVFFESQVEKPVVAAPGSSGPKYPADLKAQRVQGSVLAMFVVDEQGHIDSASIKVLRTDHPGFEAAVREALPSMRFLSAEIGGRKVKQLVQQPFSFALAGDVVSRKPINGAWVNTAFVSDSALKQPAVLLASTGTPPASAQSAASLKPSATSQPPASSQPRPPVVQNGAYFESQVEKPVSAAPGSPGPVYPVDLRTQKVEGTVLASFIVGVDGKAEAGSLKILKSDRQEFSDAITAALPKMRFVPAQIGGRSVRQVVQQPFSFSISR